MCTATIYRTEGRFTLTMNRDETSARAREVFPSLFGPWEPSGQWLAPADGERGGTWIGVNARGVTACILNAYAPGEDPRAKSKTSRGAIVPRLLERGDSREVLTWIRGEFDPSPYASFHLVMLWLGGGAHWLWSGQTFTESPPLDDQWFLMTTSYWHAEAVEAWRRQAFQTWLSAGCEYEGYLPTFNIEQPPGKADWAPLMDRPWSYTRSITQVVVDTGERRSIMRYWARRRCTAVNGEIPDCELALPLLALRSGDAEKDKQADEGDVDRG